MTENSTAVPPRLRFYLNLATLDDLPAWSKAPRGDAETLAKELKNAGFHGVQAEDAREYERYGLGFATLGRANTVEEIRALVARWASEGHECGTLHIGWGFEDDDEVVALAKAMVASSRDEGIPVYVETHRATITQDPWRTLKLVEKVPEVRFNGDFSHWYTGSELTYGNIGHKMDLLHPVFQRVRFIHARVGNSSAMQVPLADPSMSVAMEHYREMWTMSMEGFLNDAGPEETLIFSPELLRSAINYARRYQTADGTWEEDSDRWLESLALNREAVACFLEAEKRTATAGEATAT